MINSFKYFRGYTRPQLVGIRGDQHLEPGYVFAPYIPIFTTPIVIEERISTTLIRHRYGTRMVNPEFFGNIIIDS
jgi:hypothetical protein